MAYRIKPTPGEFNPTFSEEEIYFIRKLLNYGYGPYEDSMIYHMRGYAFDGESIRDSLIEKRILEFSPDYGSFRFTRDGIEAFASLMKKQDDWEKGKLTPSEFDKSYFLVDGKNKLVLLKKLEEICTIAEKEICIQDPYPEPKLLLFLSEVDSKVKIKLLISIGKISKIRAELLKNTLSMLKEYLPNIEIKLTQAHSRRIIVDNYIGWEITGSQTTSDTLTFSKLSITDLIGLFKNDWEAGRNY